MAAPGALVFFNAFKKYIADGTIDLDSDTINVALFTSSLTPNVSTQAKFADLTNELTTANGYNAGGQALANKSVTQAGGTATFDADDHTWSATGSGLTARYEVLYKVGTANGVVNPLIGYRLLDSAPADVAIAAGNSLVVVENAAGIFTLA